MSFFLFAVAVVALASFASGNTLSMSRNLFRPPPILATHTPINGSLFFQQLIDHDNPDLGTFPQKFWYNDQYWAGPGSPVVLFTPGEIAAAGYTGYLTNATITGAYAEAIGGAVVMLEHRYWGESSPYADLSTKNMQQLTLKNSIADLTYFAKTVNLPFDKNHSSSATNAPWVLSGGSYSGALSAWTEHTAPGTFWAYHASSAPVQAVNDYWQYFAPIQEGMAQNCSKDVSLVVGHVDQVLQHGSVAEKTALKTMFGLQNVKHDQDFASALENGPWLWQSNSFTTGYSGFFQFCDYIENVAVAGNYSNTTIPDANGVGLNKALAGYAKWTKTKLVPGYCAGYGYWTGENDTSCFDTFNASSPLFTDRSVNNSIDRQWNWMLCNEPFAYWQDGAPSDTPSIVSRLVGPKYWNRQCALFFPPEGNYTYGSADGKTVADVNRFTGGWSVTNTTRLTWTNGEFDPWRTSGVSSEFRPGGPLASTKQAPVNIIPGGFHCSDLNIRNGKANAGVQKVIDTEVAQIKEWVAEYYTEKKLGVEVYL